LYDALASALEKLGLVKDALKDTQRSIKLQPDRWEPYARAARLFLLIEKPKPALSMLALADERLSTVSTSVDLTATRKREAAIQGLSALRNRANGALAEEKDKLLRCPISVLPVELLEAAFTELAALEQRQAVILSHVCRHWRDLCLKKPSLWHSLHVDCRDMKQAKRKIETWLLRSRGYVSSLEFVGRGPHGEHRSLMSYLAPLSWARVRRMSLSETSPLLWTQFSDALAQVCDARSTGNLVELELSWDRAEPARPLTLVVQDISQDDEVDSHRQHHLKSLSLRDLNINDLAASALTTLKLCNVLCSLRDQQTYDLLVASPGLQELWVENCMFRLQLPPNHLPIAFHGLKDLRLSANGLAGSHPLDVFTAPALEILRISPAHRSEVALKEFANRSGGLPLLQELGLRKWSLHGPDDMESVMRTCIQLRTLELGEMADGTRLFLSWLAQRNEGTLMCPRLKHVKLVSCADLSTSAVLNLVKAHSGGPSSLSDAPSQPVSSTLQGSRREGARPSQEVSRISSLVLDGCPLVEAESLPWLRQQVKHFSCRYMTKKQASYKR
jgi:F-box/TPR repeat protein Pof3